MNSYKVVILGSVGVGKTSIIKKFLDRYCPDETSTIGVEKYPIEVNLNNGSTIKLCVWDTAGQERFRNISRIYTRNACGALIVFSITDKDSFDKLKEWHDLFQQCSNAGAPTLIVGNKSDLKEGRNVTETEARLIAEQINSQYIETSAVNGNNIKESFEMLAEKIFDYSNKGLVPMQEGISLSEKELSLEAKKDKCC